MLMRLAFRLDQRLSRNPDFDGIGNSKWFAKRLTQRLGLV
jgi:hypothetical protein